ncbi:MAG: ABC transporter substrate-binding protein, partial [Candidatus Tectomicrobia bacterium]|nr:ABC transporter substrate-binding protein [Candidatus Tectomicrobia bacterium]
MSKRIAVFLMALVILASVHPAEAQQAKKVPRVGYLNLRASPDEQDKTFLQGLRDLGYVEGRNITIEYRWAEGKLERLPDLAAELVRLKVDVIVTATNSAIRAARQATRTIPIVMAISGDPVGSKLIASLARPGGNITGMSLPAIDLSGKRLELFKETVPRLSRVGVLWNSAAGTGMARRAKTVEIASREVGVTARSLEVRGNPSDFEGAFSAILSDRLDGFLVVLDPFTNFHRKRIVEFAAKNKLPSIYEASEYVDAGGLLSYGPNYPDMFRRAAYYVDRILKGAKPADLPVEQPVKFELVINLKTAKALGLTTPPEV